jgi:Raf kinase inhibitor-like YbhB/YbcL family protein
VIRAVRPFARIVAAGLAVTLITACDTGDGKQLQPYDPADYPLPTPTSLPEGSVVDTGDAAPPTEVVDPLPGAEGFSLTAPWLPGTAIDPRYTCDGEDVAPALSWGAVPEGTVEVAIVMVDDSAVSNGQPFVHWVIAGLDPAEIALAEGDVPPGAVQALNFFGDVGYGGPCPPPGDAAHLYRLTAYALNTSLQRADGTLATEFLEAIATATIGSVDLNGTYQR